MDSELLNSGFFFFLKQLDRFIPNRSAMDFDYAHYMMMEGCRKGKENPALMSPSRSAYQKRLAEACNMHDRTRILAFKNKPPTPVELFPKELLSPPPLSKSAKPKRCIPQVISFKFLFVYVIIM